MWFKKEGGAVIKSLEIEKIQSVAILQTTRTMGYFPYPKSQLMLMSEATSFVNSLKTRNEKKPQIIPVNEIDHEENSLKSTSSTHQKQDHYAFLILQTDGKEHILRGAKVDRVMKWMNIIATVSKIINEMFFFLLIQSH
jgi:hypothetical protein